MDSVLGRKQRIKNSDWIETFDKIEQLITKEELDQLVNKTIQDIKAKTKGKQAAYAWSGGKDSLVLGEICRRAGISSCVLVISNLEYKAFTQWVEDNKPPELTIINTGQDLKWLVAHPHMLFPQDSKYAAQWFHIVQHRGQAKYYKENNLDMLLLGRRRADGNYVGKEITFIPTVRELQDTALCQIGRMSRFWHISIIIIWLCRLYMIGKMAICAEHILGQHGNGQEVQRMPGAKSMRLTAP